LVRICRFVQPASDPDALRCNAVLRCSGGPEGVLQLAPIFPGVPARRRRTDCAGALPGASGGSLRAETGLGFELREPRVLVDRGLRGFPLPRGNPLLVLRVAGMTGVIARALLGGEPTSPCVHRE
jgi:hypothetical protein